MKFSLGSLVALCLVLTDQVSTQQVNANGIPTLVYNCAKMPAICQNVNRRNPLFSNGGGEWGNLQNPDPGTNHITLTFDSDATRHKNRRKAACPRRWKTTHTCPETNQPSTVPQGATIRSGAFPVARYLDPNNPAAPGTKGYNRIADAAGQYSGMIWTCDEWPPAMSTQGGNAATTICAPQNGRCGNNAGASTRSEQDFQSSAHTLLRTRVDGNTFNPNGQYVFYFRTEFVANTGAAAARVEYFDANGAAQQRGYQRRGLNETYILSDEVLDDMTIVTRSRLMTPQEIHLHNERRFIEAVAAANYTQLPSADITNIVPHNPARQLFETLPQAPPLPVIDLTRLFVQEQAHLPLVPYAAQVLGNATAQALGLVSGSLNSLNGTLSSLTGGLTKGLGLRPRSLKRYNKRQEQSGPGMCDASNPCPDGSCCNGQGKCGYGPENCGDGSGCISNCDATAACGKYSAGGNVSCPLNVCCSGFGYCGTGSDFCDSPNPEFPCQEGFGSCSTIAPPSCGGSSAAGRTIAYYQVANTRERQCQRITPAQIDTKGLTHLNLAFASIDPSSFNVIPASSDDIPIYKDFVALKSSSLQTWIAIGGWDFNDPGSTRTTWSDLASTTSTRAQFINSAKSFMDKYGFQGIDIDWEYPGAPDRAGQPEDTENFVSLVKEMRASFGSSYGISVTLPASYWYMRWFDPIAMQDSVDFFGLMTYDLHGPGDAGVKQIGKVVYGQTNIPEIYNWTLPLWYDKLDASKINMGLAYYGRGYTLSDPNCNTVGCAWTGTSNPAPCTNFGGVASLQEIQDIIIPSLNGIQPTLLEKDMMKQLTWSNQWIGYDDEETITMKRNWASSHCFGGTMIWSIDLYSGSGSGDTPDGQGSTSPTDPGSGGGQTGSTEGEPGGVVYIDPGIYTQSSPTINCAPPCTFILPPLSLATPTTITFPPYTTSLDVAWSESTGWTSIIETTVLTPPSVTTTEIEVWAYTISDSNSASTLTSTHTITSSVRPPIFTITDNPNPLSQSGVTHSPVSRNITAPPYPWPTNNDATTTSSSSTTGAFFPIVTFKPGTPGPICKTGCGKPCIGFFCTRPCLLDCTDGGDDFPDPVNPNPPKKPTPSFEPDPDPTTIPEDPTPSADPDPEDPSEDDPEDPEEEDEDDFCAAEFDLPEPTYNGPIGNPTSSVSIAPPPPPPSPTPKPNPTPPSPDPATESLHCYDSGLVLDRGYMIKALDAFCDEYDGTILDASANGAKTLQSTYGAVCIDDSDCFDYIRVSVTVINQCRFTMDGPDPDQNCGRILREAIDKCDTSSTKYKQGGTIDSNCAQWLIDPNLNWDGVTTDQNFKRGLGQGSLEDAWTMGRNITDFKKLY